MTDDAADSDFLSRWSRRKRLARGGIDPDSVPGEPPPGDEPPGDEPLAQSAAAEREELTDADMPPLETLGEDSDYSVFLSPKVSEGLRRAALRKLFGGAAFNVTDGLDDYDEDFRSFSSLIDVATAEASGTSDSLAPLDEPRDTAAVAAPETEPDPEVDEQASPGAAPALDGGDPRPPPIAEQEPEGGRPRAERDDDV